MHGLDLFSGIGGIGMALSPWVRTIAYCERDRYAQGVLLSRMQSGDIDQAPIWDDVTTLRGDMLPKIDIIFGGFPCQDLSVAGLGAGLAGERSRLFFEIVRLVKEIKPTFVFLENVPAIRTRGLSEVVNAFTEMGYDCRWTCLSARDVGAPHKRERWFLLAYFDGKRLQGHGVKGSDEKDDAFSCDIVENWKVAHAYSFSKKLRQSKGWDKNLKFKWALESDHWDNHAKFFLRVCHGIQYRSHRIKCLGNSVVPLQVREAFKKLAGMKGGE
jgi:DNA (cytosine-5)-methyltransferase 1